MRKRIHFLQILPYVLLLVIPITGCPIYQLFGVACPSCGMTRAFLAAARFDFKAAFRYHPLFGILFVETAYVFIRNAVFRRALIPEKAEQIIGIGSLGLLLIVWIIRQWII